MNGIINFFVGFISTTIGAISGIGGGVIIKPVLDMLGQYDISSIGVLSTFTVFTMSIVTLIKNLKNKVKLDGRRTIFLAFGSIMGGVIGKNIFIGFLQLLNNDILAQKIQSVILFLLMIVVLVLYVKEDKIEGFKVNNVLFCGVVGIVLGIVSSFLGIGGGPLNVIVLMYILGMDAKSSAIHSIFIIFFSQGSKLISILLGEGLGVYNLDVVLYMIVGGILGGIVGSNLSNIMDKSQVKNLFKYCMIALICFNLYNVVK